MCAGPAAAYTVGVSMLDTDDGMHAVFTHGAGEGGGGGEKK